jgi:hypothetical protein
MEVARVIALSLVAAGATDEGRRPGGIEIKAG